MGSSSYRIDHAPALISHVRHLIQRYLSRELKAVGCDQISPSHGGILLELFTAQPMTMSTMARRINRDPSTVTTLINKLRKFGYVQLVQHPTDQRAKVIQLTDRGLELKQNFFEISERLNMQLFQDVEEEDAQVFIRVLDQIKINLSQD